MNAPLVPVPADSLVAAYAATDFLVLALRPVTLRVDQVVAGLDDWLRAQRCESAVVISARSPFSQVLAEDEEDRRHEELRALVERVGLRSAPAVGRSREGTWQPERCICVLDLADDLATAGCDGLSSTPSLSQGWGRAAACDGIRTSGALRQSRPFKWTKTLEGEYDDAAGTARPTSLRESTNLGDPHR